MTKPTNSSDISHVIGSCICADEDMTCWFNRTWSSLIGDYDDKEHAMYPLQEAEIKRLIATECTKAGLVRAISEVEGLRKMNGMLRMEPSTRQLVELLDKLKAELQRLAGGEES